jgi:inorganic pyrophosphatase
MVFRYPVFEGGNLKVTKRINEYVFSLTQNNGFEEVDTVINKTRSLKEIAKKFFLEAKDSAVPEYPQTSIWNYGFETDTLMLDKDLQVLTLIHNYSIYAGGAHPNYFT